MFATSAAWLPTETTRASSGLICTLAGGNAALLRQLTFMSQLFDLNTLTARLEAYVTRDLGLSPSAGKLVQALLWRGEMPRGDAGPVTGLPGRTARQLLSRLGDAGLVASITPKGPVSLRFNTISAETLFPRLFPALG